MRPLLMSLLVLSPLSAQTVVDIEATAWRTRLNEVRKPSEGGTTFSFPDLLGSGPTWAPRFNVSWTLNERHGLRVLLAPFEVSGTGVFRDPVVYQGHTFQASTPTEGVYRFNSWRVTWRYTLSDSATWRVLAGATAKIRDAKVLLRQNGHTETNSNLGFVPLIHLYVERRFPQNLSVVFETDALTASQGRAVDAALMVRWQATRRVHADVGYRVLEGGADNKELYTWARLDGWRGGMGIRF